MQRNLLVNWLNQNSQTGIGTGGNLNLPNNPLGKLDATKHNLTEVQIQPLNKAPLPTQQGNQFPKLGEKKIRVYPNTLGHTEVGGGSIATIPAQSRFLGFRPDESDSVLKNSIQNTYNEIVEIGKVNRRANDKAKAVAKRIEQEKKEKSLRSSQFGAVMQLTQQHQGDLSWMDNVDATIAKEYFPDLYKDKKDFQNLKHNLQLLLVGDIEYGEFLAGYAENKPGYIDDGYTKEEKQWLKQGGWRAEIQQNKPLSGGAWDVIDTINLPGKGMEMLDDLAQKIPTAHNFLNIEGREKNLQDRINNINEEERWKLEDQFNASPFTKKLYGDLDTYIKATQRNFTDELLDIGYENVGPNLGKMLANAPGSAIKTATAIGRGLTNPADTITGLGQAVFTEEGRNALKERYIDNLAQTIEEDPVGLASDALTITELGAKGVAGGLKVSGLAKNTKVGALSQKVANFGKTAGEVADLGLGRVYGKGIDALTNIQHNNNSNILKAGAVALRATQEPLKVIGEGLHAGVDKLIGLDKRTKQALESNPFVGKYFEKTKQYIEENGLSPESKKEINTEHIRGLSSEILDLINSKKDTLRDTGELYEKIKNANVKFGNEGVKEKLNSYLKEKGINIKDGKLDFSDSVIVKEGDMKAIEKVYDWATREGYEAKIGLNQRKKMDKIAYPDGTPSAGTEIIKGMRNIFDENMKEKIPGLKEADKLYSERVQELEQIEDGLIYKQGDRKGQLRDNFEQIVNTLDGPNRARMLQRLDELRPGLGDEIRAVHMMGKLTDMYFKTPTKLSDYFTNAVGLVGGGLLGSRYGAGGMIAGAIGGWLTKQGATKLSQRAIRKAIDNVAPSSLERLKEVEAKIQAGKGMSPEERMLIDQIGAKILQESELLNDMRNKAHALPAPKATVIGENGPQVKNPLTPQPMKKGVIEIDRRPKGGNILGDTIARNAKLVSKRGENIIGLKTTKKTGNSEQSEYTSAEKSSSITSPGNIRAGLKDPVSQAPVATTFSFSQRDIKIGGKNYHHKINDNSFKTKHIFNQEGVNKHYVDNFNKQPNFSETTPLSEKAIVEKYRQKAIQELGLPEGTTEINLAELMGDKKKYAKYQEITAEMQKELGYLGEDVNYTKKWYDDLGSRKRKAYGEQKHSLRDERGLDKLREGAETKSPKGGEKYQVAMDTISGFNKKKFLNSFQTDSNNPVHINAMKEMFKDEYQKLSKEYVWRHDFKPYKTAIGIAKKRKEQGVVLLDEHYKRIKNPTLDDYKNEAIKEREKFVLSRIKELYGRYLQDNGKGEITQANKNLLNEYPTIEKEILAKEGIGIDEYYDIKSDKKKFKRLLGEYHESIKNRIETIDPIAEGKIKTEITNKNQGMITALYKAWESNNATIKGYASSEGFDANHEYYDMKNKYVKEALDEWAKNKINDIEPLTFGDVLYFNFKDGRQMSFHRVVDDKSFENIGTEGYVYKGRMIKREGGLFIGNEQIVNPLTLELEDYKKLYLENRGGIRYQKYGIADNTEKTLSAQQAKELKNIRNGRSVEEIANDYGVAIEVADKITTPEGIRAYGKYGDGVITLAEKIKEGTAPHELFHATFDMVDHARNESILEGIMKEKKLDKVQAEEYLADSFSEYFRTGRMKGEKVIGNVGKPLGKKLYDAVKDFFKQVKDWITGVSKNKNQIKKLFDEILDGEIDRDMLGEILENKKDGSPLNQLQDAKGSIGKPSSPPATSLAGALEGNSRRSIDISLENANLYRKKLSDLAKSTNNYTPESFLVELKRVFSVGGESSYISNTLGNDTHTLRISNHSANARNNKLRGYPENNASIVIKLAESRFRANKGVDLVEFVYNPENLTPEKMQGIIKGIQDWIDSGEYTDKGYDATHTSVRATLENGEVKYQLAYHGSPYEFEKFDSIQMEKRPGAHAHGWGHYVAVDDTVARSYATNQNWKIAYKGKEINKFLDSSEGSRKSEAEKEVLKDIANNMSEYFDRPEEARDRAKMEYERNIGSGIEVEHNREKLRILRQEDHNNFAEQGGNLYEVDIPDDNGANYLKETGTLSTEQKKMIRKGVVDLLMNERGFEKLDAQLMIKDIFKNAKTGGQIYSYLVYYLSLSKKEASLFLNKLGFDGISYHDGGAGDAYVIFNDNKLEIKKHLKDGVEIKRK